MNALINTPEANESSRHDDATRANDAPEHAPAVQSYPVTKHVVARKRGGAAYGQTGPKSQSGKRKAAKNALKSGLYVPTTIHPEEAARLTTIREALFALTASADVDDHPMAAVVIDNLAMAQIRIARLQSMETAAAEHWFADVRVKQRFCSAVGLASVYAEGVPHWYFGAVESEAKREAIKIERALREANLLAKYQQPPADTEQALGLARLRAFVAERLSDGRETLAAAITRHFEGPSFAARVRELCSWMKQSFVWELRWADNPRGFEAAIAKLKAEVWGEIYANDARQKLYVSLQRQVAQQLALFEQMRSHAWAPQALSA